MELHTLENDVTQYFPEGWLEERGITRAVEVYVVHEPTCRVHICSLDPSLEAWYVGIRYEGDGEITDEIHEELREASHKDQHVEYFRWWTCHRQLVPMEGDWGYDEDFDLEDPDGLRNAVWQAVEEAIEDMRCNGEVE